MGLLYEPVVDRAIWEQVQEKRGKIRRRKPKDGERNMFRGLLVCADCGHNLNYHFNQGNPAIKYTRAKKLTPRMLNELVNHIEVHQAEKIDGEWVQKLAIHYNCIGALFIPNTPSMPVPDVTVNTRKGVYVSYEPAQNGQ